MHSKIKYFLTSFTFLLFLLRVECQEQKYFFSHLGLEEGLTHGVVTSILKDSKGLLWIGTDAGLNLYDGIKTENYVHNNTEPGSLISSTVTDVFEGPNGEIWILTPAGINIYQPNKNSFTSDLDKWVETYNLPNTQIREIKKSGRKFYFLISGFGVVVYDLDTMQGLRLTYQDLSIEEEENISSLSINMSGELWLISSNGIVRSYNLIGEEIKKYDYLSQEYGNRNLDYESFLDSGGDLWIYTMQEASGIYRFENEKQKWWHYDTKSEGISLNTDIVRDVVEHSPDVLWIGTDHGGINVLNKKSNTIDFILNDHFVANSLVQNSVVKLYRDDVGGIWVGTYKNGVNYYHENLRRIEHIKNESWRTNSLPFDDVNCFVEDNDGNTWIGSNGEGIIFYNKKNNKYSTYKHDPKDNNSLSSDVVVSMLIDDEERIWIGTYYGGLNLYENGKFKRYLPSDQPGTSVSEVNIWDLYQDSKGKIWVGTLTKGVDLYDSKTQTFYNYPLSGFDEEGTLNLTYIFAIEEDPYARVWIGGGNGLEMISTSDYTVVSRDNHPEALKTLTGKSITNIYNDGAGRMWIGTVEGLFIYEFPTQKLLHIDKSDGLPHDNIMTLIQDDESNIWISTPNGIARIPIDALNSQDLNNQIVKFSVSDGLQSKVFNRNSALKKKDGTLMFGGPNGINKVNPSTIKINQEIPKIIFTDFKILNQSIRNIKKGDVYNFVPDQSPPKISLKHDENVFSIEFAALNLLNPHQNQYEYMLEGFDEKWISIENYPSVTYTNLDPGLYDFKVKASNNDGVWNQEGIHMSIEILPPFWRTSYAYLLYLVGLIATLLFFRKNILKKERAQFEIERERREAQQLKELNTMKLNFFTNISHELRTPISLILAPIERLKSQVSDMHLLKHYQAIETHTKRLLRMVDQLLDFRKMEMGKVELFASSGDLIKFTKHIVEGFYDLGKNQDVDIRFSANRNQFIVDFDQDKVEKILFNLLSNAIKFTLKGGQVDVSIDIEDQEIEGKSLFYLRVADTGVGINEDRLERVFERYYSTGGDENMINHGSGLGLSIVRQFTHVHGGKVSVQSTLGKGSTFCIMLPFVQKTKTPILVEQSMVTSGVIANEPLKEKTAPVPKYKKIVLVEDNVELRNYIEEYLSEEFNVVLAGDGLEGWKVILHEMPDIIISDLIMPKLDGIGLCDKVKTDPRTQQIPMILLTADHKEQSMLKSLQKGVDDFITKPFKMAALMARVHNLIDQREMVQEVYSKKISIASTEEDIESRDERFIKDALESIREHIDEPEFTVEKLAHHLNMSRVNLYKKMVSIIAKTPHQFIKDTRLNHASQLLEKSQMTVTEIAYQVGYNDRKYFSKHFKEKYGLLPSQYRKNP